MNEHFEFGEHVRVGVGEGKVDLGHVLAGPHDVGGEQKYTVKLDSNDVRELAFTAEAGKTPPGGFFTRV